MAAPTLLRTGGGLASIAAGVLLLLGHLANLGGDLDYGTVLGSSLVLAAHMLLVFALMAIYAVQAEQGGLLNSLGMVLGVLGTTLNCAAIFVEITGAAFVWLGAALWQGPVAQPAGAARPHVA